MTGPAKELRQYSPVFRRALLKSERLPIQVVLVAIGAAFAIRSLRTVVLFSHENFNLWLISTVLIAIFAVYELLMLRAVNRSIHGASVLPRAVWIANIVIETTPRVLALVFLSSDSIDSAYKPLANPAVLLFFLFIILSTLRLYPAACRISGLA